LVAGKSEKDSPVDPVAAFKTLYAAFRPTAESAVLAALRSLRWNPSAQHGSDGTTNLAALALHIRNARSLFEALGVSAAVKVEFFLSSIGGTLGTASRESSKLVPPVNLDEAIALATRKARQLDDFIASGFAKAAGAGATARSPHAKSGVPSALRRSDHQRTASPTREQATRYPPRLTPEERERCKREGLCLRCRQKGHVWVDCPGPLSLGPRSPSSPATKHTERRAAPFNIPAASPSCGAPQTPHAGTTSSRPHRNARPPARLRDYDLAGTSRTQPVMTVDRGTTESPEIHEVIAGVSPRDPCCDTRRRWKANTGSTEADNGTTDSWSIGKAFRGIGGSA